MRVPADGRPSWADPDNYPCQVRDLVAWLHDALPDDHPARGVTAQPVGATAPDVWLHGSSDDNAALMAHFGLRTAGEPDPVPSVEEALEVSRGPGAERWLLALRRRSVVGASVTVRASMERHAADYQMNEIMAVTICHEFAKRKPSYELLAQAFDRAG